MPAESYLRETRAAVDGIFGLLQAYDALTPSPSLAPFLDEQGVISLGRSQAEAYLNAYTESLALDFSKAMLAGSILQVAHKALQEFSTNAILSAAAATLGISATSPQLRFAVGREIHGIPAGLLIYAGRIQYNHYEEGRRLTPVPLAVFDALLQHYYNDPNFDMAYELEWPSPRPVSHYIVRHELQWFSPSQYTADMTAMLGLPLKSD